MARPLKPLFRSRHHRNQPEWHLGDPPPPPRRIDWPLVMLVVIVFVAGFVWIIPALEQ
ncbi:MAG: hypothetical protein ACRECX_14890 [Methyloceanibacter sp.]|uniref:hypothetical protein n=1 Tax=Methyloceanibacter sp. TaxID=1965321 RepID=UPI003D6C880F